VFANAPEAVREESFTFLTLPEWLIVFRADEYARFIAANPPSDYPYLAAVSQYWGAYRSVCRVTSGRYPFQTDYHVMLAIIGVSFTTETLIKSAYENTIGRVTEWTRSGATPEDQWAARTAAEYGTFIHNVPWYDFPFAARLGALWRDTPLWGPDALRKWERRTALTAEYGAKAVYGWLLGTATRGAYSPETPYVLAHVTHASATTVEGVTVDRALEDGSSILKLPRYEAFTSAALALDAGGGRFVNIAGNDEIMLTAIMSETDLSLDPPAQIVAALPMLVEPGRVRVAVHVPLAALAPTLARLRARGDNVERLYDY
jgi:hypothetical protein